MDDITTRGSIPNGVRALFRLAQDWANCPSLDSWTPLGVGFIWVVTPAMIFSCPRSSPCHVSLSSEKRSPAYPGILTEIALRNTGGKGKPNEGTHLRASSGVLCRLRNALMSSWLSDPYDMDYDCGWHTSEVDRWNAMFERGNKWTRRRQGRCNSGTAHIELLVNNDSMAEAPHDICVIVPCLSSLHHARVTTMGWRVCFLRVMSTITRSNKAQPFPRTSLLGHHAFLPEGVVKITYGHHYSRKMFLSPADIYCQEVLLIPTVLMILSGLLHQASLGGRTKESRNPTLEKGMGANRENPTQSMRVRNQGQGGTRRIVEYLVGRQARPSTDKLWGVQYSIRASAFVISAKLPPNDPRTAGRGACRVSRTELKAATYVRACAAGPDPCSRFPKSSSGTTCVRKGLSCQAAKQASSTTVINRGDPPSTEENPRAGPCGDCGYCGRSRVHLASQRARAGAKRFGFQNGGCETVGVAGAQSTDLISGAAESLPSPSIEGNKSV
ncbi:hypothetical protein EDB83DRAFT_2315314 [Lactarius deliciosus]|nr:hypothetical protein EDB83DRAFT_2315314 [Lactarius deliciosus]